jgi:hypothetical protein
MVHCRLPGRPHDAGGPIDTHDDLYGGGPPCKANDEAISLMECLNVWMGVFKENSVSEVIETKYNKKIAICICTASVR